MLGVSGPRTWQVSNAAVALRRRASAEDALELARLFSPLATKYVNSW